MSVEFGVFLKNLRLERGLSQDKLAQMGGISTRTLSYWEAGQHSPGAAEWQEVMRAVGATPEERARAAAHLTTVRGLQMAREETQTSGDVSSDYGALPNLGDLLRALRMRRGWPQTQLAEELGVGRATVNRWENTRNLPAEENLDRLCDLLQALPEERKALHRRRLEPPEWDSELTWDECLVQLEAIRRRIPGLPMTELMFLALKRQLRLHLGRVPEAAAHLAYLDANYATLLYNQDRMIESYVLARRSLSLVGDTFPWDPLRFGILNLLAIHANRATNGYDAGIHLYDRWLSRLPDIYRIIPYCDMALFAALQGRSSESAALLNQARRLMDINHKTTHDHCGYHDLTFASILRASGRPFDALYWLPAIVDESSASPSTLIDWASTLIEVGDRQTATRYLNQVANTLVSSPNRHAQRQWDALTRRL